MDIKIVVPTAQEKGYLRRQREALKFAQMMKQETPTPETVDAMTDFICQFVTEPKDKSIAKEAILDLSQEEFEGIIAAIGGQNSLPKANGENVETGI